MTNSNRTRRLAAAAALTLGALGAACGERADDPQTRYRVDGDTGAAAPATVRNMTATPGAPDSTPGVAKPTGTGTPSGDTLGAKAKGTAKNP